MSRVIPTIYYKPVHFRAEEVVPKSVFDKLGQRVWWLFDSRLLYTADCIWEFFYAIEPGPMICNTWFWDGSHQYRGFRPGDCETGAEFSAHKRGAVLDLVSPKHTAEFMRNKICENNRIFQYVSRMEKTVPWLHFETTNTPGDQIVMIDP